MAGLTNSQYAARDQREVGLGVGIFTIPSDPELIPQTAAQASSGWLSTDGQIELTRGRFLIGGRETNPGYVKGEGWGSRQDGTQIHFRKINTKIQYFNAATNLWVNIVTGLTDAAEYTFSPYQSAAGTFVYATGVDGIYKIHTANPADYTSMYDATKNFKGKSIINPNRMVMWDLATNKIIERGSYIDVQNSTVYTTVTGEATTSLTGTLAFKAGDPMRTCFSVVITLSGSGEVYVDNYNGGLVGSLGGTGTINYTTGAYTISAAGTGTAAYLWEMTNNHGITDFTFSATRTAGQGYVLYHTEGGDAIQKIIYHDGSYYAYKINSVWKVTIDATDLIVDNIVFRRNIGLPYWQAAVDTSKGIVFMDTSSIVKPRLTILQPNLQGDNLEPVVLATQFDFSRYLWDMCSMNTFGEYIVFSGRTINSDTNDTLFLYNLSRNSVDILPYRAKTIAPNTGRLYIGDTQSDNVFEILTGFDDDNALIDNFWMSNDKKYGTEYLKKVKRFIIKGLITSSQSLEIYKGYEGGSPELIGTVLGNGTYVDTSGPPIMIGTNGIGTIDIGGGDAILVPGNPYLAQLKISCPKFRKVYIMIKAIGIGFVSVNMLEDHKIEVFENRLPKQYRTKQNVSLNGQLTNQ